MNRLHLLLAASALAACPAAPLPDPLPEPPRVLAFTASPANVSRGQTVTVKWKTENAQTIDIVDLSRGSIAGAADKVEGEVQVPVTQPTVFVISAKNARGARASSVASVNVEGVQAAGIVFAAYPPVLAPGRPGLLVWNAPQAKRVEIAPMGGQAIDLKGQLASGSIEVTPTADETTYLLTADGATRTVNVVRGQGITEFTASKSQVQDGDSVTLSWKTEHASKVRLTSPGRGLLHEATMAELAMGSFTDTVASQIDGSAINYLLEAEGKGPLESKLVTVYFGKAPQVLTADAPKYVKENLSFTLTFTTVGADRVEVRDGMQIVYRTPSGTDVSTGSVVIPAPAMPTDFVVAAISSASGATATKPVRVTTVRDLGMPTFTAAPTTIAAGGSPVTLTWNVPNAVRTRIIENGEMTVVAVEGSSAAMGTATVYPNAATTTYRLQASNTLEPATSASASVTVTTPATARSADGGTVYQSQNSTQLAWTVGGATAELIGFGTPGATVTPSSTGFVDISTTGTKLPFARGADDAVVSFTPVDFETFLGNRRTEGPVWVSTNGFLQISAAAITNARSVPAAIPGTSATTVPEDFIAPLWANLELGQLGEIFWAQSGDAPNRELVVQWNNVQVRGQPASSLTFQARVHQSGAISFEYQTVRTTAPVPLTIGYQGRLGLGYAHAFTSATADGGTVVQPPASTTRVAFGQAQRSPAIVSTLATPGAGMVRIGTGGLRLTYDEIVKPTDILVTEVMNRPNPAVPRGQWIEIGNFSNTTIDLSGWEIGTTDGGLFGIVDAGVSVPARGFVVIGQSSDPMENDGLPSSTSALPTLALTPGGGVLRVANSQGFLSLLTYPAGTQGVAISVDRGPFVARGASSTAPFTTGLCNARPSQTFGNLSPSQRGTPGASGEGACMSYVMQVITPKFKDISSSGQVATLNATGIFSTDDEGLARVTFSSPVQLFGRPVTGVSVSTNGLIVPNPATGTYTPADDLYTNKTAPGTGEPDIGGVIAPFWDDLRVVTTRSGAGILSQRFEANQDPNEPRAHWVVQWNHLEHLSATDDLVFEVKFFDNGDLEYHYAQLTSGSTANYGNGNSATVWLEQDGAAPGRALVYSVNQPVLSTSVALRFTRIP